MSSTLEPGPGYLTTTQAAALIGRSQDAVRGGINNGSLPGTRYDGRQYILREDLLAWDQRVRRHRHRHAVPAIERTAALLAQYHSATVAELAELAQIHPGNIRKHLDLLARNGRAERRADGEWTLIAQAAVGAA